MLKRMYKLTDVTQVISFWEEYGCPHRVSASRDTDATIVDISNANTSHTSKIPRSSCWDQQCHSCSCKQATPRHCAWVNLKSFLNLLTTHDPVSFTRLHRCIPYLPSSERLPQPQYRRGWFSLVITSRIRDRWSRFPLWFHASWQQRWCQLVDRKDVEIPQQTNNLHRACRQSSAR